MERILSSPVRFPNNGIDSGTVSTSASPQELHEAGSAFQQEREFSTLAGRHATAEALNYKFQNCKESKDVDLSPAAKKPSLYDKLHEAKQALILCQTAVDVLKGAFERASIQSRSAYIQHHFLHNDPERFISAPALFGEARNVALQALNNATRELNEATAKVRDLESQKLILDMEKRMEAQRLSAQTGSDSEVDEIVFDDAEFQLQALIRQYGSREAALRKIGLLE